MQRVVPGAECVHTCVVRGWVVGWHVVTAWDAYHRQNCFKHCVFSIPTQFRCCFIQVVHVLVLVQRVRRTSTNIFFIHYDHRELKELSLSV